MARGIMVANRVYEEMKKLKGKDKSFSEVISEALENSRGKEKTAGNLLKFAGALKRGQEDEKMVRWSKRMWKKTDEKLWRNLR